AGENVLAKFHGKITHSSKYGREATADIDYNGERLLSTEMAGVSSRQPELDFYITKSGFFLFDQSGALIFGGESHAE
ncbi:ABC transporter ATP-binding protein, partial [Paenibacillus polymyxa]|nr:ABC transporter ATP-binding protein [Paenibacillus polymyxa]